MFLPTNKTRILRRNGWHKIKTGWVILSRALIMNWHASDTFTISGERPCQIYDWSSFVLSVETCTTASWFTESPGCAEISLCALAIEYLRWCTGIVAHKYFGFTDSPSLVSQLRNIARPLPVRIQELSQRLPPSMPTTDALKAWFQSFPLQFYHHRYLSFSIRLMSVY